MRTDYRDTSRPTVLTSVRVLKEYRAIAATTKAALESATAAVT
jgi:hypothetical protein